MMRFQRIFIWIMAVTLASCAEVPTPTGTGVTLPEIGTRAIIKRHGQEIYSEVSGVSAKSVTTEFYWQGELLSVRDYYQGLYARSGREGNTHFEVDFDEAKLDSLFPLKVGNEVSFGSVLRLIDRGVSEKSWVNFHVSAQKKIDLSSGKQDVFVIDIATVTGDENNRKTRSDTVFYAPDLGMILKSVTNSDGGQSFWRVMAIELPGDDAEKPKKRKSATMMI